MIMHDEVNATPIPHKRVPWNKGKLTGAKPPLRPKRVWSIRTKLQIEGRIRDLAMFNLAIDSKLRGCDVVAIRVEDVAARRHGESEFLGLMTDSNFVGCPTGRSVGALLALSPHFPRSWTMLH